MDDLSGNRRPLLGQRQGDDAVPGLQPSGDSAFRRSMGWNGLIGCASPEQRDGVTMRGIIAKRLRSLRSLYIDVPALRPGTIGAYALAFLSVGVATALRLALDPFVEGAQFITFFPAIVITTLISGFGAGFFGAVLSTAAADFFVLSPRFSFFPETSADLVDLLLFGPLASYLVIFIARMRDAIEREQAEASKDRLQLALDAAQLGWWQYNPLHKLFSFDVRSKEVLGTSTNVATLEEFMNLVHPDYVERMWARVKMLLGSDAPKRYANEFRLRRGDGDICWVESLGLTFFEGDGRKRRAVSVVGTLADITERKGHEEKLHLLMREVNHRARNMLSVVDAIAHQTVASSPEDYVERFSERIRALAVYQDLLVRSEWQGVEIDDLVRAQLAPFADLIGSRIAVRGPKLCLNAASAQAVGLVLHELTTNAGKYGALSNDVGRLDIGWWTDGETFKMSWTEREGPPVCAPQGRGFGTVVVREMAERSVDGRVELDYAPSGVTWSLTCPAANVLERRQREG
jgi:PAS domain S-box-containing protein